jgi:hypothetical protein
MTAGPATMALGILWLARIPPTSHAWILGTGHGASLVPPTGYFTDVFPGLFVFGFGLTMMVAPLTTALMTSVPARNAGIASAINNAISRVGSPLVNAVIFVAVASSFYAAIAKSVPSVDTSSASFREQVAPLNQPSPQVDPQIRDAAKVASTDAFHLAMLVSAGLLLLGASVNGVGIRNPSAAGRAMGPAMEQPPQAGSGSTGPVSVTSEEFAKGAGSPAEKTGPARDTS